MPRFFHSGPLSIGDHVALPDALAHHVRVLRLQPGNTIVLFNGEGGEYTATLLDAGKREAAVEVKAFTAVNNEASHALTLAQALPEGSKMDWIVEKAVELGVASIQPLAARRSVVKLAPERAEKKLAHWQAIVVAASEQSGRTRVPQLAAPVDFGSWIARQDLHLRILLSPRAQQPLSDWARHHPAQSVTLIVGPEGGFTEDEEEAAVRHGALPLSMGPRILRTETAGLAALAALHALWGEM